MDLDPLILREALAAYIGTFPVRENLDKHLAAKGLSDQAEAITRTLGSVVSTADAFLMNYPGGVPWTPGFSEEYDQHLIGHHPWLDRASLGSIYSYSRWICWHDGLNR